MDEYLKSLRNTLKDLENKNVTFVIGNESCDLDSAVCAIVYAYWLHINKGLDDIVCPLLNVSKDDLPLRTEVIYCMETLNLSLSNVPLIEDVDNYLSKYKKNGDSKLQIVLVDHNKIFDLSLEANHLVEIIDHHQNYKESFGEHVKLTLEMVGSCATLVMKRIWKQDSNFQDENSLKLCRYAIITDTVNFSEGAKKATPSDEEVIKELDKKLAKSSEERTNDYQLILKAKQDTKRLTVMQCLRKDLKIVNTNEIKVAVASHMELGEKLVLRENFESDVKEFLELKKCEMLIVMGFSVGDDEEEVPQIRRDLLILTDNNELRQKFDSGLKVKSELELHSKEINIGNARIFEQGDVSFSRKKIIPIIEEILCS